MKYAPRFRHTNGFLPVLLVLTVLLVLPFIFTDTYARHTLILVFIYAILASNWDILLGLGGIVNSAHIAFFALGLYGYSIAAKVRGVDPWIAFGDSLMICRRAIFHHFIWNLQGSVFIHIMKKYLCRPHNWQRQGCRTDCVAGRVADRWSGPRAGLQQTENHQLAAPDQILRKGNTLFAMINGPDDAFINHGYCRSLEYGNIWQGTPVNIANAGHAPLLEKPEVFNEVFGDLLAWAWASFWRGDREMRYPLCRSIYGFKETLNPCWLKIFLSLNPDRV